MLTKSKVLSNTGVEIGGSKFSNVVNTNINITTDKANTDDKQAEAQRERSAASDRIAS